MIRIWAGLAVTVACVVLLRTGHGWVAVGLAVAGLWLVPLDTPVRLHYWWRRWHRWRRTMLRPTVVYCHRFSGLQGTFCRRGGRAYIGISNRPDLRKGQHAAGSPWYPLTDPSLYTERRYRTRIQAAVVERWSIALFRPIGNTKHNGAYRRQANRRAALWATAALIRQERTR